MSEKKDLTVSDEIFSLPALDSTNQVKDLLVYMPEHQDMLVKISQSLPEIQRASSLFYKTQSQFMDNMLTVSHPTPLRNLRQILAEMNKTRSAMKQAHFKCKKKEIKIKMKERAYEIETDELKKELLDVEIMQLYSELEDTKGYISGAIRKLTNYTEQYDSIMTSMGVKDFNEIDFEAEEEKANIMRAFGQALDAARPRSGLIDEGNHIFLRQMGINGASAQRDIYEHMAQEGKIMHEKGTPDNNLVLKFLEKVAEKYKGCSIEYARAKGMTGKISELAALKTGDLRLIKAKE